jgi:hypothetical protein
MRKLFLALVAVALLLFGAAFPLLFPRPSPVTKAAYDRIENGMTLAEVEAILGGPAGDHRTRPTEMLPEDYVFRRLVEHAIGKSLWWEGDAVAVAVVLDDSGIVLRQTFVKQGKANIGVIDLLRWRLNRLKDRLLPPAPTPLPPP